ncbi:MAG TPA: branched-chain amino acid ABC transporter ATP-binding protein/permease [Burkholderiales bacterium]|nr:branched-chain amino acid ABC transporter ATP-binding protein/permease [Burkholderiales bacterium]
MSTPSPETPRARRLSPWPFVILAAAVAAALLPYYANVSHFVLSIFMQATTYAIAVLGMVVVLGYAGQINLAQAAFFGFGAYGVALGTVSYGLSFWVSLAIGTCVAGLAGGILGLTTLRLGGHYLAMITISFQQIFDLVAVNWIEVTHGPDGIAGIPRPSLLGHELSDDRAYLLLCAGVLYALIVAVWYLPRTRLGRAMRGVRENELAAEVVGVHTLRTKVIAFTMSAALGGIGGGLYAGGFAYISPDNFNFQRAIEFLSMVLLGGAQSPFGGALGTTLLILLPEWLKEMPPSLQFIKDVYLVIYGLAVILIMVFMPEGIWGLLRNAWAKVSRVVPVDTAGVEPLNLDITVTETTPLLRLEGLQKHFGGLKAVDGVDLEVKRGTVHALIGPNGSGKTTTLNVVNGIYKPTGGRIIIDGIDVSQKPPHERAAHGLGRTFQNIRLFPSMSALENVIVGAQRDNNPIGRGGNALRARAMSALEFVGLADKAGTIVRSLPYGHQRLVEIARALAGHPKLLLLDEPAAGLNQTEKMELVELLKKLRSGHGLTIFLIDHDMGLVEKVSDRISVLNFGRKIADGTPQEVLHHPDVIAAYLGDANAAA